MEFDLEPDLGTKRFFLHLAKWPTRDWIRFGQAKGQAWTVEKFNSSSHETEFHEISHLFTAKYRPKSNRNISFDSRTRVRR